MTEDKKNNQNHPGAFVGNESFKESTALNESFKNIVDVEKSFGNASALFTPAPPQNTTQSPSSSGASAMMPDITPKK